MPQLLGSLWRSTQTPLQQLSPVPQWQAGGARSGGGDRSGGGVMSAGTAMSTPASLAKSMSTLTAPTCSSVSASCEIWPATTVTDSGALAQVACLPPMLAQASA